MTGGARARDDTGTSIASFRDLEEAFWGARDLRGGVLRSLSPDAPIIDSEEKLVRLNRTLEVGSSIPSLLEVTSGPLSSLLGGEDSAAATVGNLGGSVPCGRKRLSVPLRGRTGRSPLPQAAFSNVLIEGLGLLTFRS